MQFNGVYYTIFVRNDYLTVIQMHTYYNNRPYLHNLCRRFMSGIEAGRRIPRTIRKIDIQHKTL